MLNFAINHMTAANTSYQSLLELASGLGCVGIEARTDLAGDLFDGLPPETARSLAADRGLQILALAEVSAFNDLSDRAMQDLAKLSDIAERCASDGVVLIPRNDGLATDRETRTEHLLLTLEKFTPVLAKHGLLGFIEPLGFVQSSLRYKNEIVNAMEQLGVSKHYKLVHDTFHHTLAGSSSFYPQHTAILHISGVVETATPICDLRDEHRILVDERDRLNNLEQIARLLEAGYSGPLSVEAFSPIVHKLDKPRESLLNSFHYIEATLAEATA